MDQCSIVLYLHKKGLSPKEIHEDLVATLGPEAKTYRTVARYVHDAKCTLPKVTSPPDRISHQLDESDQAILLALEEQPFSSVRQLSRATHLSRMTVYRRLTGPLNFCVRHLRWVPHLLSDAQKAIRVESSQSLLRRLQSQQDRAWHDIVTLDESWFYYTTDHESIWLPADEKVPERERYTVQSKKLMVTIVWNPNGFHLIDVLPSGSKFNASYYTNNILSRVSEWRQEQRAGATRKLIIHADNARPHTAAISTSFLEENGMTKAHHPPYSPDLAPSDFYLFGYIKRNLSGTSFDEGEELLSAIVDILDSIEKATLNRVFFEWMERLRRCLDINGDYVE